MEKQKQKQNKLLPYVQEHLLVLTTYQNNFSVQLGWPFVREWTVCQDTFDWIMGT